MKKIYSFVLMAAMLLVGTSAWATINVPEDMSLKEAISAAANGEVIVITESPLDISITDAADQIILNANKHIYLNLNNSVVRINNKTAAKNAGIAITRGILEITGPGEIQNGNATGETKYTSDLIRVYGTDETVQDPKDNTPYSQVIVGAGVSIKNLHYLNNATKTTANPNGWNKDVKCNAISITEKSGSNPALANGARVDVYGKLFASTYCVKVNGSIKVPNPKNMSPYVYIHTGAQLKSDDTKPNAVAAYSSGYGRWLIEGECSGSTGLYCKGGTVEIANGSHIISEAAVTVPVGQTSGVNAGGSAIVVESNASYPGDISVVITGGTIEASAGYAIEETITTATDSEVDLIAIQGGKIDGGSAGAIIVENQTKQSVDVVGGNIEGTLNVVEPQTTKTYSVEEFINGTTTDPEHPSEEADYIVAKDEVTNPLNPTYEVTPNLSKVVTMNAYGMSTFSTDVNRKIKPLTNQNLKAYKAAYSEAENVQILTLTLIADSIIPANTGVILIGDPNVTYSLNALEGNYSLSDNKLKPASAWASQYAYAEEFDFYVLHDNMMYLYTGATMKPHKAYLDIYKGNGNAPKRIQMVIAETQDIENVEFEAVKAVKFIENGQVLIKRGEKVYNVQGQIVK